MITKTNTQPIHGKRTLLADGPVGTPRVSGDGKTVVWNQMVDDNLEIMRYRDGKIEQLTHNALPDMHAVPNDDGSVIVWDRCTRNDNNDPDGRWDAVRWENGVETVLTDSQANSTDTTVSGDGKVIAWSNDIDGKQGNWKIQTLVGDKIVDLTPNEETNAGPVLNQDGSRMFWRSYREGGSDIAMRDQDGVIKPVTDSEEDEVRPAITADGKTLVYSVTSEEGDDDLVRLTVEPRSLTSVSEEKDVDECWPSLSADGKTVAWTNFDRRGKETDVQVLLREGDQTVALSENFNLHTFPNLSADGKTVVWMDVDRNNTEHCQIFLWQRD